MFNFDNLIFFHYGTVYCDAPEPYQVSIQDPATQVLEWMTHFHDFLMLILILIVVIIFCLIYDLIINPIHNCYAKYNSKSNLIRQYLKNLTDPSTYNLFYFNMELLFLIKRKIITGKWSKIKFLVRRFNSMYVNRNPLFLNQVCYINNIKSEELLYLNGRKHFSLKANKFFSHCKLIEIFWTIVPAIILYAIALPSFALLYSLDDLTDPYLTLKITGHQWYWSYEYNLVDIEGFTTSFDSYMINYDDLMPGMLRLLEVDNRLILPTNQHIRLLITSADVLHSWAVPSFGIKVDACPGRLNHATLFIRRPGLYYGQCSEICGINHGFMPIVVMGVSFKEYLIIRTIL